MTTSGYWAPPVAVLPPVPPAPTARRRSRVVLSLCVVLGLVVGVGLVRVRATAATAGLGQVIAVEADASAAAGWGPTYVDERGRPARWDPCEPVRFVVATRWAPPNGRRDLAEALRRLGAASGLRFVDGGDTDEVPTRGRLGYSPDRYGNRWAPLLVGWVPPAQTDLGLGTGVQGISLALAVPSRGGPSIVSGLVALDADHRLASGFGPGTTEGEVLQHELAHAVGLGHVLDPTQVMYPQTTSSESAFGAGDRAGLAALGAPAGCHPAPEPRPLRLGA